MAVALNSILNELDQIESSLRGEHDLDIIILRMAELAPKFSEVSGFSQTDPRYSEAGKRYLAILSENPIVDIGLSELDYNYSRHIHISR
jgi:hypothetical protein